MIQLRVPAPRSPGQILREDFLPRVPSATQDLHAQRIGISREGFNLILNGRRAITAESALRLARYFGTLPEFWLEAQMHYDLYRARQNRKLMRQVEGITPPGAQRGRGLQGLLAAPEPTAVNLETHPSEEAMLRATVARQAEEIQRLGFMREFLERRGLLREAERSAGIRQKLQPIEETTSEEGDLPDVSPLLRRGR